MADPLGEVSIKVGIQVEKEDAEIFLKLVEMYVNQKPVGIAWKRDRSGSVHLEFTDGEFMIQKEEEDDKD